MKEPELQSYQYNWITKLLYYFNNGRLPRDLDTNHRYRFKLNALNYNIVEGIFYQTKTMMKYY